MNRKAERKFPISKTGIAAIAFVILFAVVCGVMSPITVPNATLWSLFPPVFAIGLALVTKEVYSSLFLGVLAGAAIYSGFQPLETMDTLLTAGFVSDGSDGPTGSIISLAGIIIFLVTLGAIVSLVNKAGGSAAFGEWAQKHIKTRPGAMLATFALGVLIFIDDYFNCLTVGAVMRPVTDSHKISRAKLAYLIDATAAPICMIAPISSWAAAVADYAKGTGESGLKLFIQAIPYNYYSLLTLAFIIVIAIFQIDYGPMKKYEANAISKGVLFSDDVNDKNTIENETNSNGKMMDLILPVVVLIAVSVFALVYVGGIFEGNNFIDAFSNTDATVGLPWAGIVTLVFTIIYMVCRRVISFNDAMKCIPDGFVSMVAPILIVVLATALKNMTSLLDSSAFVQEAMANAGDLQKFLPAIIFLVAVFISFSTGTSWGTFGILIPIVTQVFAVTNPLFLIGMSACLAGSVCGDHISPISDTTIMSSAGAQCNHLVHVKTQIPYALTVAAVSCVSYIVAGFVQNVWMSLAIALVLLMIVLVFLKTWAKKLTKLPTEN